MENHNSSEKEMDKKKKDPFDEIIEILDNHPEISQLNAHIEQKHYGQ